MDQSSKIGNFFRNELAVSLSDVVRRLCMNKIGLSMPDQPVCNSQQFTLSVYSKYTKELETHLFYMEG